MSVEKAAPVEVTTIPELLIRAAWFSGDTIALRTLEESITYGELLERARQTALELKGLGAEPGSCAAIRRPNGVEWLVAYWGATLNHCVVVPLSLRATPREVESQLAHTRAAALFSEQGLRPLSHSAVDLLPSVGEQPDEAVHLVQFTSGSTGEPKGAMLTHRGLIGTARHQAEAWGLAPAEAAFVPNPFCHILGLMYGVLMPTTARTTALTLPRFDLDQTLELLIKAKPVAMAGAPAHFQALAEQVEQRQLQLPDLRLGFTGGAVMAPRWVDRVRRALHLEAMVSGYGMSEVGSVAHTRRDDTPEQVATSVGFLVPGLEGRVVDPKSGEELPDGEVGELRLRGTSVMRGYLDNEPLTREALVDGGWLRTHDLMRRDPSGRLTFVGRLDDMFTVGGYNVYPAEIERALLRHPEIAQAAVVPAAHDRLGSIPVAFVRGHSQTLDTAALLEHCRRELRGYMVPRHFETLEELPLNAVGKVDRRRLKELAESVDVE